MPLCSLAQGKQATSEITTQEGSQTSSGPIRHCTISKISSRRVLRKYVRTDHCASRYFREQPSFILYIPQAIFRAVRLWGHGDHDRLNIRWYRGPALLLILRARQILRCRLISDLCCPWDDICAARKTNTTLIFSLGIQG